MLLWCVGIHAVEVSGRWDQTLQDANDEAAIVAVVLCVGVAVAAARGVLKFVHADRSRGAVVFAAPPLSVFPHSRPLHASFSGPPVLPLRV
jgi:hypothetical protein